MRINKRHVIIVGGGASGIFAAIQCCEADSHCRVTVLEKSNKLLGKVKVSGGGRCNVTHACFDNKLLVTHYPRGSRELQGPFSRYAVQQVVDWFKKNGVNLKTESDGRMFPDTDSSQTIIDCFLKKIEALKIDIRFNEPVSSIRKSEAGFEIETASGSGYKCDAVIAACGGNAKMSHYDWLLKAGIKIIEPVPSLFTFNVPQNPFKGLEGVSMEHVLIKIAGTKLNQEGPFLITHWGISGPAVLKLSARGARLLFDMHYEFDALIDFVPAENESDVNAFLLKQKNNSPVRMIHNHALFGIPQRLWERICLLSEIDERLIWADISNKKINTLSMRLKSFNLKAKGKTTFKEEFVTAGGIDLKTIEMKTMESKIIKGLYFCGELMDVDGLTGGFNFQHAWTSGFIAGRNAGNTELIMDN